MRRRTSAGAALLTAAAVCQAAAAAAAAGSSEAALAGLHPESVDLLTVLCGAEAARAYVPLIDSLLYHRSVPLRLHVVADKAARRALPSPRPPATRTGAALSAVETRYVDAEAAGPVAAGAAECATIPLFAAELLPEVRRLIVLAPEAVVTSDIAGLWQHFGAVEASGAVFGAVAEQSSWYPQSGNIHGGVLLLDLQKMRAVDWPGLVKQATVAGQSQPKFGEKGFQDVLNAMMRLPAIAAFNAAGGLYHLPCSWNVQLTDGPSLCAQAGCTCAPAKILYADPGVDTAKHSLHSMYEFWVKSGGSVPKEYLFDPQPLVQGATPATIGEQDDEGCADGWAGEDCDECAAGFSGDICDQRAPAGIDDEEACAKGWAGEDCDECAAGFSGDLCDQQAGSLSAGDDECEAGWTGEFCDVYVVDDTACAKGWAGTSCDMCAPGFSGDRCMKQASIMKAASGDYDEKEGCAEGWAGEDCDECAAGYSGDLCDQKAGAGAASAVDEEACSAGWAGEDCDECAAGYIGELCEQMSRPVADKCAPGWAGPLCNQCATGYSGDMCDSSPEELKSKWARYRDKHFAAVATFSPCSGIECYNSTIMTDLEPFREVGTVSRDAFEQTRSYNMDRTQGKGRMNHYQIIGGKLYRSDRCPSLSGRMSFHPRCEGIEGTLLQILDEDNLAGMSRRKKKKTSGPPIPDTEFIVNINDKPQVQIRGGAPMPMFSFSKPQGVDQKVGGPFWDIMYPAWTFWGGGPFVSTEPDHGLGRWDKKRDALMTQARRLPWDKKDRRAFFRGSRTSHQRDPLVQLSRAKPHLAFAAYTKNQAYHSKEDTLGLEPYPEITLEEHCKFRFLFNFRGVAASFRFKHLFMCNSLVFHVGTRGDDFVEFYYDSLVPWVHYIPIKEDLSDMDELIMFARENDDVARTIAHNGYDFVRKNLAYEDIKSYWRHLLIEYTKLLDWEVKKHPDTLQVTKDKHRVVDKD